MNEPKRKQDPELAVMAAVFKAVNTLTPEAACRVLEYVRGRKVREQVDAMDGKIGMLAKAREEGALRYRYELDEAPPDARWTGPITGIVNG